MRVLLLQLDGGGLPNLALMRIATHHRDRGDEVCFRRAEHARRIGPALGDDFEQVYASAIFTKSAPLCKHVQREYGARAIIGGTGWSITDTLEAHAITTGALDYSIYPSFRHSIGFTQRGCRLKCPFCVVPKKEGGITPATGIMGIWRGDPWPKNLLLLDNDFFGDPAWRSKIADIEREQFKVCFSQGINARLLSDEACEAIASIRYFDNDFKTRRIYTAWDNRKDEERLFTGLNRLVKYGVKPRHIMVYMLVGYWPNETAADREYRRAKLRDFGAMPYPMPYVRTSELVGFQRWVIGAYDKRFTWREWSKAHCRPEKLGRIPTAQIPLGLEVLQ